MILNLLNFMGAHKYTWRLAQFIYTDVAPRIASLKEFKDYYILKKKGPKNIPPILYIEPTNICNGGCVFCAYKKINDPKDIMSFEIFKKSVNDYKSMGGKIIDFTPVVGEIFLDKGLFEKISYAKSLGMTIRAYTNGFLLKENYNQILDWDVDELVISIGDLDSRYESKIFNVSEEISKQKIDTILKLAKSQSQKIMLAFRPSRPPYQILQHPLIKILQPLVKMEFMLGYDNWGGSIIQSDLIGIMKLRKPMFIQKHACKRMYENISILSNGDVRLCGCRLKTTVFDDLVVGNIMDDSLQNIMKNEKVKYLCDSFEKGKIIETCKNCTVYESCVN